MDVSVDCKQLGIDALSGTEVRVILERVDMAALVDDSDFMNAAIEEYGITNVIGNYSTDELIKAIGVDTVLEELKSQGYEIND